MSFVFLGVDHVQLAAHEGCEPEARAFYGDLLGWPEIPKPESLRARGGVWFQCGAHQVHIGVQKNFAPAVKAHPAFEVTGLEDLLAHLADRGVAVVPDDSREAEQVRRAYVNDPFGNRIEFLEGERSDYE